ncbi:MAG: AMP-binding protein [Rhizomicrobium sp.]
MLDRLTAPWLDRSNYPLDWNGPVARAAAAEIDLTRPIFELFAETALRHPDRIALDDGARSLSYAETLAAARALARRLARETAPDDLVGILLPSCCDFTVAMLACLAAGRLFVPLDSHYPQAWLGGVVQDCGMAVVIGFSGDAEIDGLVPPGVRRIALGETGPVSAAPLAPAGPDAPAFVLFTSGSTGKPKGIVNSQRALLRRVAQYAEAAHIDETDRFLPLSSECTIAGLRERFAALLSGATLRLIDVQRNGARAILDRLAGVTVVYAVPALLRALMPLGAAPPSLRVLRVGGEAVLWSDIDALRAWLPPDCRIELGYSSTEAPIMQWFVPADFPREGDRVPLGYPLAGNALAVVGENGEAATPGEAGELVLRSPYVALGRWVDGKVDAGDFPADPKDPSCRIHRTGDLVRLRADGLIDLVGRKDRQIKIRGQRVEPAELEAAIRRRPGIRDAAVFPRRVGQHWWLIAYIVGPCAGLKAALRDSLPAALQPQRIHSIDAVPRLASAKLDMAALAALDEDWQRREVELPAPDTAAPAGKTEEIVAAIWRRVLKRERIGRNADFFDCGGDSLSTLEIMFGIEDALAVELPVTAIFATPTIASLAAAIDDRRPAEFSPLVPIKDGVGTPLFIVHGLGGNVMELFPVGRRVAGDGPVYAIQARGLDGRAAPATSIAAMADDYIAEILKRYPHGAFHLAGYSSGGLIAFEMARLLYEAGEPPASLTLIDAQSSAGQWPFAIWLGMVAQRARFHARALRAMPMGERLHYAGTAILSFGHKLLLRLGLEKVPAVEAPNPRIPSALQAVADATTAAVAHYAPGFYNGVVHLVVPEIRDPQRPDPARLWRDRCAALTVSRVPGDHRSMVRGENAVHLAAALSDVVAV